jgi:hypothetical protein
LRCADQQQHSSPPNAGKLNLIDLAGSERVAKSGALDDEKRLKEVGLVGAPASMQHAFGLFYLALV